MAKNFLLEIGLEEMPARFIAAASTQLEEKVQQFLLNQRIRFESIESYSTPRRLAIYITQVAEQQDDLNEELRGPAKRIAIDEQGNWSKAALGFAKGKGLAADALYLQEVNGEEFVFVRKHEKGKDTISILPELADVVSGMSFPKNMRWGTEDLKFVRPIRWLVALFGEEVVPMTIAGITSGRTTYGHRFLGSAVNLESPERYVSALEEQYCIVSPSEREARILQQIDQLRTKHPDWEITPTPDLLNELVHLVEYPTVFTGTFDPSFLEVPSEVLTTSMRVNQRYIDITSNGQLQPYFIGVRNGNDRSIEQVIKGNEKVLSARLADARFFFEEDQKVSIDQYNEKLETVVWHEEHGSLGDKVRRIRELAVEWANLLKLDEKTIAFIERAASICKFDLVTHMVYEFPELQGLMGYYYALKFGESAEVANAIREHYYPVSAGGEVPSSEIGALVAIADKMDTIVGSFLIGIIPTGSQDPYGLRRAAHGIVQILLERQLNITLEQLFASSLAVYRKNNSKLEKSDEVVLDELRQFFGLRIKNILQEKGIRYDIIDAVLPRISDELDVLVQKADILQTEVGKPEFKKVVEAFNRVGNLAKKAESDALAVVDLVESVEKELYQQFVEVKERALQAIKMKDYKEVLAHYASLQSNIEAFFEQVMVMVEDEKLRRARLALLKTLSDQFTAFADFSKIIFP